MTAAGAVGGRKDAACDRCRPMQCLAPPPLCRHIYLFLPLSGSPCTPSSIQTPAAHPAPSPAAPADPHPGRYQQQQQLWTPRPIRSGSSPRTASGAQGPAQGAGPIGPTAPRCAAGGPGDAPQARRWSTGERRRGCPRPGEHGRGGAAEAAGGRGWGQLAEGGGRSAALLQRLLFLRTTPGGSGSVVQPCAGDASQTARSLGRRLVKRCNKPDRKEFLKVARLTALGFLATGVIGFLVKVIFIPVSPRGTRVLAEGAGAARRGQRTRRAPIQVAFERRSRAARRSSGSAL